MEDPLPLRPHRVCYFSQRCLTIVMVSIGVCLHYTMRQMNDVVLSRFIPYKFKAPVSNFSVCDRVLNITAPPASVNVYNWDKVHFMVIKDTFWIGYIITSVAGGALADKFGGKHIMTLSTVTTCIVVLLTPVITKSSGGNYIALAFMRILFGTFTGPVYSASNTIVSHWGPVSVRGILSGILYSATPISVMLNNILTNKIITYWNSWESVFYFYSIVSIIWVIPWNFYFFSNPWDNPYMDEEEFNFLDKNLKPDVTPGNKRIPWISLLTCIHLYPYLLGHVSHISLWRAVQAEIPLYMTNVLKIDLKQISYVKYLPLLLMAIASICLGFFVDYLVQNKDISLTSIRKMLTTFGLMGPAVFGIMTLYSGCNKSTIIIQFFTAVILMSCHYIGTRANSLDLAPNFSGIIMGLSQVSSILAYLILPDFLQKYILSGAVTEWKYVFWGYLISTAIITMIFIILGSAEVQDWNRDEDEEESNTNNR